MLAAILCVVVTGCRPTASAATGRALDARAARSNGGEAVLPPDTEIRRDPRHGAVRWMQGGDLSASLEGDRAFAEARARGDAGEIALLFLAAHRRLFGLADPRRELRLRRSDRDALDMTHVRFDQVHHDVPVFGAELIVHLDAMQHVTRVNGSTIPTPAVTTTPDVSAEEARRIAAEATGASAAQLGTPALVVHTDDDGGVPRLAYRVAVARSLTDRRVCIIDARTGSVIATPSTLQTIR